MYFLLKDSSTRIITVSFFVYLFVNLFENIIHYNIGKFSDKETHFEFPSNNDWLKIIAVMMTFAFIQGVLTCFFTNKCF